MAQNASEEQIRKIVEEVVSRVVTSGAAANGAFSSGDGGVFPSIDAAVQAATRAQSELVSMTLEKRRAMIEAIRRVSRDSAEDFSRRALDETGMGGSKTRSRSTAWPPMPRLGSKI